MKKIFDLLFGPYRPAAGKQVEFKFEFYNFKIFKNIYYTKGLISCFKHFSSSKK